MCLACVEYLKGKLSFQEAERAAIELSENEQELDHFYNMLDDLWDEEDDCE